LFCRCFRYGTGRIQTEGFLNLVNKILTETKGHIGTGLIGGQWLLRVLSDNGRPDVAYTIATQKRIQLGLNACKGCHHDLELWNGDTAEPRRIPAITSCWWRPEYWFHAYLAGIHPILNNRHSAYRHAAVQVGDSSPPARVYRTYRPDCQR
jgi:hypothetical protein